MIINKKRIRSIGSNLSGIQVGQEVIIALPQSDDLQNKLTNCGFSKDLEIGERVLPTAVGPVTQFNAVGKYIIHKDQPMETAYHQIEWSWQEFHGPYDRVEKTDVVERPYKRYPRTLIDPPSIELFLTSNTDGELLVVSPPIIYSPENEGMLKHIINIFLEIFNECHILNSDLQKIIKAPIKRLNWEVLPRGKKPWSEVKPLLDKVIDALPEGNKYVIKSRFETINAYEPDILAVGRAGFSGYIVFGFESKNLYILESVRTDNATYVIDNKWELLSSLTKAELLNNDLHKERVIHRKSWFKEMRRILSE